MNQRPDVGQRSPICRDPERGQTTIALAAVLVFVCLLGLGLMTLADAMVHRARARTAADAVALAAAADPPTATDLIEWYLDDDISIVATGSQASALSGPSRAIAWAERTVAVDQPAPVLVAIVARAAQLTGVEFDGIHWMVNAIALPDQHAGPMRLVAAELGLCEAPVVEQVNELTVFELC